MNCADNASSSMSACGANTGASGDHPDAPVVHSGANATEPSPRVVLLMSPATYRAGAFLDAGKRIGLDVQRVVDLPAALVADDRGRSGPSIDFGAPGEAINQLVAGARADPAHPVRAVLAIDDRGALIAAHASRLMGLAHNDPDAALAARDKFVMREALAHGGVPVPTYRRYPAHVDPRSIVGDIEFPCVVKPLLLSGSRGVIRADDAETFVVAFERSRAIISGSGMNPDEHFLLVEQFVPGVEVALDGLLTEGELDVLVLFDKPDPLDGPFFEETIYVTPSQLPEDVQVAIARRTSEAAAAIGLRHGPVHAELRVDLVTGDLWLIELAGRSIGGLCSSVLEFGVGVGLEELILRHAASLPIASTRREDQAAGVMMIPIPKGGILRRVDGRDAALAVPYVTGLEITAPLNRPIVPLPEGESYLGFIFSQAATPEDAEQALRDAHDCLSIRIDPAISLRVT